MRLTYLPLFAVVLSCGSDATAASSPTPPPNYLGTYRGTEQGSENGALFVGVITSFTVAAVSDTSFTGTWSAGSSAGTFTGAYIPAAPGYFTLALTQTAPCPGQSDRLDGWGYASIRATDHKVLGLDAYYGGPQCLGTPLPGTVFIRATLLLQ